MAKKKKGGKVVFRRVKTGGRSRIVPIRVKAGEAAEKGGRAAATAGIAGLTFAGGAIAGSKMSASKIAQSAKVARKIANPSFKLAAAGLAVGLAGIALRGKKKKRR